MKLGIMQPYFFPYLGYFSLIKNTDKFILFDTVQYIRHGWIERNRVLKPQEGWQYVAAPLEKRSLTTNIEKIEIKVEDWQAKLIRQLEHYKKRSPYYNETIEVVSSAIDIKTTSIVELNQNILKKVCSYLGIPLDISIYSQMNLTIDEVTHPGEWALNISKALGGTEYINPPGGVELFRPEQFTDAGIKLKFLSNNLRPYNQKRASFENGLSIIDVMMFNDIPSINALIDDTNIVSAN